VLRNLAASTLRNMARHRVFTAIIVGGLGAAFAAAVLVAFFVYDKYHAESFVPDSERIYLVGTIVRLKDQPQMEMPTTAAEIAGILQLEIPESQSTRRLQVADTLVREKDREGREFLNWVDPNFFEMFRVSVAHGDLASALSSPDSCVITRHIAVKYFGTADVVGRSLELNRTLTLRITAVIEDFPLGTSLTGRIYASSAGLSSPLRRLEGEGAENSFELSPTQLIYTYLKLRNATSVGIAERAIANSERLQSPYPDSMTLALTLVPLNELHLRMPGTPTTSNAVIIGVSLLGALVLIVSGINFVNLMTARAHTRAREIAIRKVAGAGRQHLVLQFLGEAMVYVAIALLFALAIVEVAAPFWTELLFQPFGLAAHPHLLLGILAAALLFAAGAGIYPAMVLAAFPPQLILRNSSIKSGASKIVRELLVMVQFAFLIAIVICTVVIHQQVSHSTRETVRFDVEHTAVLATRCTPSFVDEVRRVTGVQAFFCAASAPMAQFSFSTNDATTEDGTRIPMSAVSIDEQFFDFYDLKPLAGRLFSAEFGQDRLDRDRETDAEGQSGIRGNRSVVINESARRRLGFKTAQSAVGSEVRFLLPGARSGVIVGVVPDFVIGPIRAEIRPLAFFVDPSTFSMMTFKFAPQEMEGAIAGLKFAWDAHNPAVPFRPFYLDQMFDAVYRDVVIESVAFKSISTIALITAAFGLLGLSVFNAQSRTKEIGVRRAIGATRLKIAQMLVMQIVRPVLLSSIVAWPAAYFASQYWLQQFPYRIELKWSIFLFGTIVTLLVAMSAVILHAWHAARQQTSDLLRYE